MLLPSPLPTTHTVPQLHWWWLPPQLNEGILGPLRDIPSLVPFSPDGETKLSGGLILHVDLVILVALGPSGNSRQSSHLEKKKYTLPVLKYSSSKGMQNLNFKILELKVPYRIPSSPGGFPGSQELLWPGY